MVMRLTEDERNRLITVARSYGLEASTFARLIIMNQSDMLSEQEKEKARAKAQAQAQARANGKSLVKRGV